MKVYEITISYMNDLTGVYEVETQTALSKTPESAKIQALENFEDEKGSSAYDIAVISIIEIGGSF
jgi:hypothetical protein